MADKTSRALRRFHKHRKFKYALKCIKNTWYRFQDQENCNELQHKIARKLINNFKACSCLMCANERELSGLTLAEQRNLISFKEYMEEEENSAIYI